MIEIGLLRSHSLFSLFCVFSCFFAAIHSSSVQAAAPVVTYLTPAGGQRGTTVDVTVGGTFDKWPVKVWVSGEGVAAEAGKSKGMIRVIVAPNAMPGVRYVRLFDEQGASNPRPFVVGTLPEVLEKEPNDEPATAQKLDRSVVVNGRLDKTGDADCFAVPLKKGQTLVASVDANRTLKSPMDGILQILGPDGFLAIENNDHDGLDPQLAFTATQDGTYVVRLFAFPAVPDSGIRLASGDTYIYRLTLTTGGFADFTQPLAVPRSAPGPVAIQGWNIPDAARTLPVKPTPESDTVTLFHPELANSVAVRVEPHPSFDLTNTSSPTPLKPPFTATARVAKPGECSKVLVHYVPAAKKQSLSIQVESRGLGLPLTPVVRVLDAMGQQLNRVEPAKLNADVAPLFNPPAEGTYTIEVRDQFGGGGPRYSYLIRVSTPIPDYTLTVPTERFYIVPGKPLEVKVAIARAGGFKDKVDVKAVGLPKGVTSEVVPPEGKADPATVTLKFSAEKPTAGGSFSIVGTVADQPTLTRTARANVADLGDSIPELWVTATDTPAPTPVPKKKK